MRTISLGKNQLLNDSWDKRMNVIHLLRARGKKRRFGRSSLKFSRQYTFYVL